MCWTRSIARLKRPVEEGRVGEMHVGAGVLVAGDVVLTCAHVVEDALKGSEAKPEKGAALLIDFPFANVYDLNAKVAAWYPAVEEFERRRGSDPSDLALLTLDPSEHVAEIEPCLIAMTDPAAEIPFSCQGFPFGYPNGAPAEGRVQGLDAGGWIDVVAETTIGYFIEPGFSGAPVFAGRAPHIRGGEIIGLCVTADIGGKRVARLIPPAQLARAVRSVVSPYRWLEHFSQRDVAYFFGRDGLTKELWEELRNQRFLLLAGPAGSGKSSLLDAGLVAKARRAGMNAYVMRPLADARAELVRTLSLPADPPANDEDIRRKVEALVTSGGLLLGVDQAEELVRGNNREQATQFLQLLEDLRNELGGLQIALASRSDGLPGLLAVQPRLRLLERNLRYIDELGREELTAAIELPAKCLHVGFAPGLVQTIVNDALNEPRVPLPIVQLCLSRLWELRSDATIVKQAYLDLGGLTGALASHANSILDRFHARIETLPISSTLLKLPIRLYVFNALVGSLDIRRDLSDSEALDVLWAHTLLQLVEVGDRGGDLRRRVPLSSFKFLEREYIEALVAGRLAIVSHDSLTGAEMVELAHDSLLTKWDKLGDWIEAQRDHLRLRSQLQREAAYWDCRGRPREYQWSDVRALEAGRMMHELGETPSDLERLFLGPVDERTMLERLKDVSTTHQERATIGDRLALLGDARPGTGVKDGLPDIVWCPVPEGRVRLGDDPDELGVDRFEMAKYPVTYTQYRLFVDAVDGYRNAEWWAGLPKRYYDEPGRQIPLFDNHPAVNVDWVEAIAYSRWLSRRLMIEVRLPTEWEWQQAATRGNPEREFPWGPSWDESRANTYENGLNRTVAVGLYPQEMPLDAPLDLAGNVWEWCINDYRKLAPVSEMTFEGAETRAIRGGAGSSPAKYASAFFRNHYRPDYRFDALGFRLIHVSSAGI